MALDLSLGFNFYGKDHLSPTFDKIGRNAKRTESTMQKVGKNMSRALNVVAASAVAAGTALAVNMVKGAIEDQKSQALLEKTVRQTTKATDAQVKAVNDYIDRTQNASGTIDDDLRPSLARLLRSTHDINKAQKLQALALDISAASGKDLQTVTLALAKANDGNIKALSKAGISLGKQAKNVGEAMNKQKAYNAALSRSEAVAKAFGKGSKQYQSSLLAVKARQAELNVVTAKGIDWVGELSKQYGGSLAAKLETTAGKLDLMKTRWDSLKDTTGNKILESLQPLIDWATGPEGQKFITEFAQAFGDAMTTVANQLPKILNQMKSIGGFVSGLNLDWSKILDARALAGVAAFKMFPGTLPMKLAAAIIAWSASDVAMNSTAPADPNKAFGKTWGKNLPKTKGSMSLGGITVPKYAGGGIVTRPHIGMVGEAGPEAIIPLSKAGGLGTTINVYVAGSVISERDLVFKLRNELGQLMRRQSVGTAAFGI